MNKVKVGILGATGMVGQRFIELLENHPYFEVTELAASERSAGKTYTEAVEGRWKLSADIPAYARKMKVKITEPNLDCKLVFSGLDATIAGEIETAFAKKGYVVVSNSKNHRWGEHVPLLSAEVNPQHLDIVKAQGTKGFIVTNSNCTIMGVTIVLKALMDKYGVSQVMLTSLQAISGAGYPGVPSLDILDNVVPYIGGEEPKAETEPLKILGKVQGDKIVNADITISAHCNRVAVSDGHLVCMSVKLKKKAEIDDIKKTLREFKGEPQKLQLPFAPQHVMVVREEDDRPQPRLDRNVEKGMTITVGRVRKDPLFDVKMAVLVHNTVRGAAGAAILNAELMVKKGYIK